MKTDYNLIYKAESIYRDFFFALEQDFVFATTGVLSLVKLQSYKTLIR